MDSEVGALRGVGGEGDGEFGARFRLSAGPGVRITAAELEPADAARLASDFAGVLGESEATYGG
ncbi:hypothetical protein ACIQJT_37460 [Streptomyces sp. NPDC091972]|uniref:hypothetical protein n=1 Tax=Streptomyces sp. NPDC091972 TaxID=3366007 RepID=UPI00381557DE